MDVTTSALIHSNVTFLTVSRRTHSLGHFHKQLAVRHHAIPNLVLSSTTTLLSTSCEKPWLYLIYRFSPALLSLRSSSSDEADTSEKVGTFSFESLKGSLLELTPFDVCKLVGILSVAISATKWVVDYYARPHDPKWDVRLPAWCQVLFSGAVMVGHWFAAFEASELHMIPGGWWINTGIWLLVMVVIFSHYYATVFLAKYVDNTAEPTAVVQFGH